MCNRGESFIVKVVFLAIFAIVVFISILRTLGFRTEAEKRESRALEHMAREDPTFDPSEHIVESRDHPNP